MVGKVFRFAQKPTILSRIDRKSVVICAALPPTASEQNAMSAYSMVRRTGAPVPESHFLRQSPCLLSGRVSA
jgi:hypothetical protein